MAQREGLYPEGPAVVLTAHAGRNNGERALTGKAAADAVTGSDPDPGGPPAAAANATEWPETFLDCVGRRNGGQGRN